MFKKSKKDRRKRVHRILGEIMTFLRRLESRRSRRTGGLSYTTGPLGLPIDLVPDLRDKVTVLKGRISLGSAIPQAHSDFLREYQKLLSEVRLRSTRPGSQSTVTRQDRALLRDLDKKINELETALRDIRRPETKFQRQLRKMIDKSGLTLYRLAYEAKMDSGYVWRLLNGERRNPGDDVIAALGEALLEASSEVTEKDLERLLKSAGFAPPKK